MSGSNLQYYLDLRRDDIDPEVFGVALSVNYISALIANGGSEVGQPDCDCSLYPLHLQTFLAHAVETAQQTRRFEQEWHSLHGRIPQIKIAWEKGQTYFQNDLVRAKSSQEEMEYLSAVDFAIDCYAYAAAQTIYPSSSALQAWFINGYMQAWRQYFTEEYQEDK